MNDLKIAPAREPSSAPAVLVSLLVLAAIAAAVFYFNPHHVADLKVTGVQLYAPHTTFNALEGSAVANGTHVLGSAATSSEDDLYVIATVSLSDKLRLPLFLTGVSAHVTFADGTEAEANLLSVNDLKRLEVIFPEIRDRATAPITDGDTVEPGQTRVGTVVLSFPGQTAATWSSKKSATLTVDLRNQGPRSTLLP